MPHEEFPTRGAGGEILTPEMFAEDRELRQPELEYLDFAIALAWEWVRSGYWTEEELEAAFGLLWDEMQARQVNDPLPEFGGLISQDVIRASRRITPEFPTRPVTEFGDIARSVEYIREANRLIDSYVQIGATGWTPEAGQRTKDLIRQQIDAFGVQPNTFLFNEVITIPQRQREFETLTEEQRLTRQGGLPPQLTEEEMAVASPDPEIRRLTEIIRVREFKDIPAEDIKAQLEARTSEVGLQARAIEFLGGEEAFVARHGELTVEQRRELGAVGADIMGRIEPRQPERQPFTIPAFEELGLGGTGPWRRVFERKYPSIVRQFQTKDVKTPETWAELLRRATAKSREEFASLSAFQRGERPSVFAPKVKTVSF